MNLILMKLFVFQVLYTSQQPRQVKIGVSLPSDATISEFRDVLESDTSISRSNMILTEICENGFLRTFTDTQQVSVITEADPVYCIEVPQLKDISEETTTSAYVLLCWINVVVTDEGVKKFGKENLSVCLTTTEFYLDDARIFCSTRNKSLEILFFKNDK